MSDNLERPSYYAQIPADVRYSQDITANAKLLYAEITALCNKTGTCWASNKYFADLYKVKVNAISGWVTQLVEAGFITTKVNKKMGNQRYLRLAFIDPITKKDDSYHEKRGVNNNTNNNNINGDLTKDLLSLVNKVTGRNFRTLPERGVKKTLDAFSMVEIESALRALAADDWHRERLSEFKIDYLIRSTTIDKFLGKATPSTGDAYGYKNGQKIFTEDEKGNKYWGGELITPENQDQVLKERMAD